jgi:FlaA1/EpsC-like NDP-sugar epimerase
VPVLGPLASLGEHAQALEVSQVIMAIPSAPVAMRRRTVEQASALGLSVLTVPAIEDLFSGRVSVSEVRKVELDDLLGRQAVQLDDAGLHRLITGRVVMVTGAGGSIGSELCRQIARFEPGLLILLEASEFALYSMEQEFAERHPGIAIRCLVGDVKNGKRMEGVFRSFQPQVVFHAAAYKHVPLMETANAWEAVQNNVLGTYRLARAAMQFGVDEFVLISTDKAVNPTNVMGATKRLAEIVCQALQAGAATRFVMVRFGNVLGSNGSVIPKFREQIARGGPVTVTHPEITRYFMSIPEAAQLVLQAGSMGKGGEIFVLDMGEPVKIADLARDMIRLSGFSEGEIRIVFTGLRPGEKLYEELLADDEQTRPTHHPKLRIARAREVDAGVIEDVLAWLRQDRVPEDAEIRRDLRRWVPEYRPAVPAELRSIDGGRGQGDAPAAREG